MEINQALTSIKQVCDKSVSQLQSLDDAAHLIDAFNTLVGLVNFVQQSQSDTQPTTTEAAQPTATEAAQPTATEAASSEEAQSVAETTTPTEEAAPVESAQQ
jgi:hypothetical protein